MFACAHTQLDYDDFSRIWYWMIILECLVWSLHTCIWCCGDFRLFLTHFGALLHINSGLTIFYTLNPHESKQYWRFPSIRICIEFPWGSSKVRPWNIAHLSRSLHKKFLVVANLTPEYDIALIGLATLRAYRNECLDPVSIPTQQLPLNCWKWPRDNRVHKLTVTHPVLLSTP